MGLRVASRTPAEPDSGRSGKAAADAPRPGGVSGTPSNGSQGWGGPGWAPLSPLTQSSSWAGLLSFRHVSRFLSSWGTPWVTHHDHKHAGAPDTERCSGPIQRTGRPRGQKSPRQQSQDNGVCPRMRGNSGPHAPSAWADDSNRATKGWDCPRHWRGAWHE